MNIKFWEKIIGVVIAIIVTIVSCLHIVVNLQGRALLTKKLRGAFKREVAVGSVSTSFPATVYVTNIDVKGLFTIDEVIAAGGLFDIFRSSFRLSLLKVINPVITIEKGPPSADPLSRGSAAAAEVPAGGAKAAAAGGGVPADPLRRGSAAGTLSRRKVFLPPFYIGRVIVSDGSVSFIDKAVGDTGISLTVKNLNMEIENLVILALGSQITAFELTADVPWKGNAEKGTINAEGWVNFRKRDIGAKLDIKNIDGISLYPYYAKWVKLDKSRIQQAKLGFNSEITGQNNDVTIDCHLMLTDIVFRPKEAEETNDKAYKIAAMVLDIFKALDGGIKLDFTIRTKLDNPQFGFDHIRSAVEERIAKSNKQDTVDAVLLFPSKLLENTVKSAADVTKALIAATASVGAQIKKGAEDIFRKEEKKEEKKE